MEKIGLEKAETKKSTLVDAYKEALTQIIDSTSTLEEIMEILPCEQSFSSREEYKEFLDWVLELIRNSNINSNVECDSTRFLENLIIEINLDEMHSQKNEDENFIIECNNSLTEAEKLLKNNKRLKDKFRKQLEILLDCNKLNQVKGNTEKCEFLNGIQGAGQKLFELKDFQLRIVVYHLRDNFYLLLDVCIKKKDETPNQIIKRIENMFRGRNGRNGVALYKSMKDKELVRLSEDTLHKLQCYLETNESGQGGAR